MTTNPTLLIYAINRTEAWWEYIAKNSGFSRHFVVSDVRNSADIDVVNDFYEAYHRQYAFNDIQTLTLTEGEVKEIICRCRLLRWLPPKQARCMVAGMESAFSKVLDNIKPDIVVSFPIDRYVSDVLERLALRRGIPYCELTASLINNKCKLLRRGQIIKFNSHICNSELNEHLRAIKDPTFVPSYVNSRQIYSRTQWLKKFIYFKVRGLVFKLISWVKLDPINLHYLDAQDNLAHKPRLRDLRTLDLIDWDWRELIERFPKSRRVLFGLQMYPEASIDYWLKRIELIDYENVIVRAASAFSERGYSIIVKDHPSQFGFRQHELIDRLKAIPNVVFLPYEVSGNELIELVEINFTMTGTLGLQAALRGLKSIVTSNYYVTKDDFICFDEVNDIESLPSRCESWLHTAELPQRQHSILLNLLQGSFEGNFFSFRGFRRGQVSSDAQVLARNLGKQLLLLIKSGYH